MRNKEGGQAHGNQQQIHPLDERLYNDYVRNKVGGGDFKSYRDQYPTATHINLISQDKGKTWKPGSPSIGNINELRPTARHQTGEHFGGKEWAKRVEDFDSAEAKKQSSTADSDNTEIASKSPEIASKGPSAKQLANNKKLAKLAKERKVVTSADTMNQAIIKMGGISDTLRLDLTGDKKGNQRVPFVGSLFSKTGTTDLSDLATRLESYNYFTQDEISDVDGGARLLAERLRQEFDFGSPHLSMESMDDSAEAAIRKRQQEDKELFEEAQAEAKARGFDFDGAYSPEELAIVGLGDSPKVAVNTELLARAIAIDAQRVDELAVQYEGFDDAFNEVIADFLKEHENVSLRVSENGENVTETVQGSPFSLESETQAQISAREKQVADDKKKAEAATAKAAVDAKKASDAKEIASRQISSAENFQLGQSAEESLSGQGDIFSQPAPKPAAEMTANGRHENATAPEHIETGVDDRELSQIVEEFNNAQASMMDGGHPITNVFQSPKKNEVVRLNDKVKVFHKDHGWMTPSEAKEKIAEWQQHAQAQGKDASVRTANGQRIVLSLFDLSGEWSKPWEEAGYQVWRFDIQDDQSMGDVHNFSSEFFSDWFGDFDGQDVYAILAATPCTDFAVSGARHFAAKDADGRTVASVKLVHQTMRAIEYFKPAVWALENPVGRIERLGGLPNWRLSFDPNHLGDTYTKKTLIWGRFNGDLPIAPVEPTEGSKMHTQYGGKSQATKNARSVTPEGFSYGFFMANNAHDNPVMAIANKYDRLDREVIDSAVKAGITEEQINDAVGDFYYMDLDDVAANDAVRTLTKEAQPIPPAKPVAEMTAADHLRAAADKMDGKAVTAKELEQYVVGKIGKPEHKAVREVESTDYSINKMLDEHPDAGSTQFKDARKSVDNGNIRERVIGSREIPTFAEDAAARNKLVPPKGVTPQVISKAQAESVIQIAADSIAKLRSSDVHRVITETPAPFKLSMASYIKDNRRDLADEVDSVMSESRKAEKPAPVKAEPQVSRPDRTPLNPDQSAIDKANKDFDDALGDLGDILGNDFKASLTPEQEQKLVPVLTRLFDAAFRKGYYKFKEAARFVLDTIRTKFGNEMADQISLDHLQGAYIGMAGRYKDQGADGARDVVSVESKSELEGAAVQKEESKPAQTEYRYGLFNRPADIGTVPKGMLRVDPRPEEGVDDTENDHYQTARHGVVVYDRKLTDEETKQFELSPLLSGKDLDDAIAKTVSELSDYAPEYVRMAAQDREQFTTAAYNAMERSATAFKPSIGNFTEFENKVLAGLKAVKKTEKTNVTNERSSASLESDSSNSKAADNMGQASLLDGWAGDGGSGRPGLFGAETEGGLAGSQRVSGHEAAATGERGDLEIYTGSPELSPGSAGNSVDLGSGSGSINGSPVESDSAEVTEELAESRLSLEEARVKQVAADKKPHSPGITNIRETLPFLHEGQQDDVHIAETRFAKPTGYGMLFTNGTGTGKTFTGLGIIKRFAVAGKTNIIITVPNDKISEDWEKSGKLLGLNISRLSDTRSAGTGIVITTYSNFGQNNELSHRNWDLIVHDEAHYLAQDKNGTNTLSLKALRAISLHPDGAHTRASMLHADLYAELSNLQEEIKTIRASDDQRHLAASVEVEKKFAALNSKISEKVKEVSEQVSSSQGEARPRILFLSATPFAYEKTVDWANGYLFDYNQGQSNDQNEFRGYNQGSNLDRFMVQHFGYRLRYNKLTEPDAKVDRGIMQRAFNSYLKKNGVLAGRMLDVKADYDRRFILVDSAIGTRIDEALQWFEGQRKETDDEVRKSGLSDVQSILAEKFDYLSRRYLLEAIKAQEVIPHIKEHLALGRKVVVFHDYKKGGGFNPFRIHLLAADDLTDTTRTGDAELLNGIIEEFNSEFKDLINSDVWGASSPITAFQEAFPNVMLFNGDVPAKQRRANVERFQDDASGPVVLLVQSAAGKEGISLHDTTGKHQRVLFNLGQPTQPTTAIQQEGRIYRTGQVTDAIFRYLNTGTNWERWAFANTIAHRASAAENLGMGELARALKDAFISGFEESDNYRAGMEGEGKGGKERDKAANNALTEYDRARAFYFGTQKKNSKTKAQEGTDYYATPEPIGLKMMEMADLRPGESVLEPSAGHGAIARWAPDSSDKTAIEPSTALRSRLAMVFDGRIIDSRFEDLHVVNKYDAIVMNPPFGSGGGTAIDHLSKATTHLRDGGRIVALIPTGPAADKKFDSWFYSEETRNIKPLITKMSTSNGSVDVPVFVGDTIETHRGLKGVAVKLGDSPHILYVDTPIGSQIISTIQIKDILPTGKRTSSISPSTQFHLVANILLPQVTFERAGTAVSSRIVVLESSEDHPQLTIRDYSDHTDINALFDRFEALSIKPRAQPVSEAPAPAAPSKRSSKKVEVEVDTVAAKAAADAAGLEIIEHTTGAGKVIRGVVRHDIGKHQAQAIDKFTFRKNGGFFIREKHLVPPSLSRGGESGGSTKDAVDRFIQTQSKGWSRMPEFVTVQSVSDLPFSAPEDARGAFLRGKIYLVADNLPNTEAIREAVAHELMGHYGLTGFFGKELSPALNFIHTHNPRVRKLAAGWRAANADLIKEWKAEYGITDEVVRLRSIEEALSEIAQAGIPITGMQRLTALLQKLLRAIGLNGLADRLEAKTDAEAMSMLRQAEMFVRNGKAAPTGSAYPMFSIRAAAQGQTSTPAFKKWFGNSKVVDADGNPLVVYHGTQSDIYEFHLTRIGEFGPAIYATDDRDEAASYSGRGRSGSSDQAAANVMPLYVKIENPFTLGVVAFWKRYKRENDGDKEAIQRAIDDGFDGVIEGRVDWRGKHSHTHYIVFDPRQVKSAIGNNGQFDGNNPDVRYSRTAALPGIESASPAAVPPRQGGLDLEGGEAGSSSAWKDPAPSSIDSIIYTLQNKHIDLKRVIAAVRESGTEVADKFNAYLQEELFHGRAAKRTQDFVNNELKPLLVNLAQRGLTLPEIEEYLHARHAKEANELVAERNPGNPKMQDGGSGMKTQKAEDYLANLPEGKRNKLESAAAQVDAILTKTRNLYVSYGLVSKDQADGWAEMFQHYIPLMREDHDGAMGIGQGFSVKGREVKHRTGSTSKVVDILANIALQRERAIVRGEKNRVAVALAGLVKLNPNPDFWSFDKVPTEAVFNEKTGLVESRSDPRFRDRENVVVAKIKDEKGDVRERAVVFNESNPRAMRMAQAMKNLDAPQMEGAMAVSAKITRYFAAINTQYNPIFGVVNLIRDVQGSLINLSSTPIAGHQKEVMLHIVPALIGVYAATRATNRGEKKSSKWADLWEEMQNEGGMTGYRDLYRNSEDRANEIRHALDPYAWQQSKLGNIFTVNGVLKVPLAVAQDKAAWIFDWLSDYNQTMEGATRLSVYKTAIDNGMNKSQAASLAKNISVNFNRKGQAGQQAGALYAFFNAAMQGSARIGETLTKMDGGDVKTLRISGFGKKAISGGILLGAIQALALIAAGFEDGEPPEFIRERNLILPIGNKKYLTLPMPLGFHAIPNIGRISVEYTMGGFKNPGDHLLRLIGIFIEAFNPMGSSGMSVQTIAPTAIDPFVALSENRDWTGKSIAREDFSKLSSTPGFTRSKDTASSTSKWLAEAINTLSGGTKYTPGAASPTPDQIDYLIGQVTGGVGRESGKLEQTISAIGSGEDLPPHKIPLIGRFFGDAGAQSSQASKFYSNLKRINVVESEIKGRRKDQLPVADYKAENPEYKLILLANRAESNVSKLRSRKRELLAKDAPKEQVKIVEERMNRLMTGFNDRARTLRESEATQ